MSEKFSYKDISPTLSIVNFLKLFQLMAENPGANTKLKPRPQTDFSGFTPNNLIGAFFAPYAK